jgi:hypothetical protein
MTIRASIVGLRSTRYIFHRFEGRDSTRAFGCICVSPRYTESEQGESEGASKDGNKCRVTAQRFVRISVRAKQIT